MQEYNKTDQQIHQLCQIIAKVNRTYVPAVADDSHTNLSFDPVSQSIYGRWIQTSTQKIILCLSLDTFHFVWLTANYQTLQSYPIEGETINSLETMIAGDLPALGLSEEGFRDPLHFEITKYAFVEAPFYPPAFTALDQWTTIRTWANAACTHALSHLLTNGETRIWPHHFDTGIYVAATPQLGIGFGLAMQDAMVGVPYFYLAGYPLQDVKINYSMVPNLSLGIWQLTDHWKGATLSTELLPGATLDDMLQGGAEGAMNTVNSFIRESLEFFLPRQV